MIERDHGSQEGLGIPRLLRPGPWVTTLTCQWWRPNRSPAPMVLVTVGSPSVLLETLGDVSARTPGAPGDGAVVPAGTPPAGRSLEDAAPQRVDSLVLMLAPSPRSSRRG